jgi:hypothetical protein
LCPLPPKKKMPKPRGIDSWRPGSDNVSFDWRTNSSKIRNANLRQGRIERSSRHCVYSLTIRPDILHYGTIKYCFFSKFLYGLSLLSRVRTRINKRKKSRS